MRYAVAGRLIRVVSLAAAVLFPAAASAANFTVSYVSPMDHTVMGDPSDVIAVRITNLSGTESIRIVAFKFGTTCGASSNANEFSGEITPPPGWTIGPPVPATNATFTAASPADYIPPNGSAIFQLPIRGAGNTSIPAAGTDQLDSFQQIEGTGTTTGKTTLACTSGAMPKWTRHSFALTAVASPLAAAVNGNVTLTFHVENRSTAAQTNLNVVTGFPQTVPASAGTFGAPSPALPVASIAAGASADVIYTLTLNSVPNRVVLGRFRNFNSTATSPSASTDNIQSGALTANMTVAPSTSTSGSSIDVAMFVRNNTASALGNVKPKSTPVSTGSATLASPTGPTPAFIPSLGPGEGATFHWSYTVTGNPLDTYAVLGTAMSDGYSSAGAPSNTGTIDAFGLSASPSALATGDTGPMVVTLVNGAGITIDKSISITFPAGWTVATASAIAGWSQTIAGGTINYNYGSGPGFTASTPLSISVTFSAIPTPTGTIDLPGDLHADLRPQTGASYTADTTIYATATRLIVTTNPSPATVAADGSSTITVTAHLQSTSGGVPVNGGRIDFSSTAGNLSALTGLTNASGNLTVTLTAPASTTTITGNVTATNVRSTKQVATTFTGLTGPNLNYIGGSLYPRQVAPGSSVAFSITVTNTGTASITLPALGNAFSFTDGTHTFLAFPPAATTIAAGQTTTLTFSASTVSALFVSGTYFPSFFYANGGVVTRTLNDSVTVTATPTFASVSAFDVAEDGDGALLTWSTDLEIQNRGFYLLRAKDSGSPETIAWIDAKGRDFSDYSWRDAPLGDGTWQYWLEDVDEFGAGTMHGPVALTLGATAAPAATTLVAHVPPAWQDVADPGDVRVLEQDDTGITWEITPPPYDATELDWVDGTRERLTIPRYPESAEPGLPELPIRELLVPVPLHRTGRVSVRAVDEAAVTGLRPTWYAGPALEANGDVPSAPPRYVHHGILAPAETLYPQAWAEVVDRGSMGDAHVVSLVVAPLRWDESKQTLHVASRLVVRVDFEAATPKSLPPETAAEARQRQILSGPSLAISVQAAGIVRVPDSALLAAGLPVDGVAVFRRGTAVPSAHLGGARVFDVPSVAGESARYWIAPADGPVLSASTTAPGAGSAASLAMRTLHVEENHLYAPLTVQGLGDDRWYWAQTPDFSGPTATLTFEAPTAAAATLDVTLQGLFVDDPAPADHVARLHLNGADLGTVTFAGYSRATLSVPVPAGALVAGANVLAVDNETATASRIGVDSLDLSWSEPADAAGGEALAVTAETSDVLTATGFASTPDLAVDESAGVLLPVSTAPDGSGGWLATVDAVAGHRIRFATASAPVSATWAARAPVDPLRSPAGADYVVIAADDLRSAAEPWAAWRASPAGGAFRTATVSAGDLYDTFSFGDRDPAAIRRFLERASESWPLPHPRYLLLVGDSTYDPDGFLGAPPSGLVLAPHVATSTLWTVSDTSLAALGSADILPDLAVGRIPARSAGEVADALAKTKAYEAGPHDAAAAREVFLADGALPDFDETVAGAAALKPGAVTASTISVAQDGATTARTEFLSALDAGTALATYVGHGGTQTWGGAPSYLGVADVPALANARTPVVVAVDCLNGRFDVPSADGLAEALLRAPHGAAAVWASSSITSNAGHREIAEAFHHAFWRESGRRLGDVVQRSLAAVAWRPDASDLVGSFVLAGDPALKLAVNAPPETHATLVSVGAGSATLTAASSRDADGDPLAFHWEILSAPAGAQAALTGADSATVTIDSTMPGSYRLRLSAFDGQVTGEPDEIVVDLAPALTGGGPGGCDLGTSGAWLPAFASLLVLATMIARRRSA